MRDEDEVGRLGGVPEDVRAALDAVRRREVGAVERRTFSRENESATGPSCRSSATFHAYDVSFASPGRMNQRLGIARSAAYVSTGWCVGPSSPRPTESCVHAQTTGSFMSAESRTDGRM